MSRVPVDATYDPVLPQTYVDTIASHNDYGTPPLLAESELHGPKMATAPKVGAEVRVVDAQTGGEKGSKLARFDLMPSDALWRVAEVYGKGAQKYAERNWEKGYAWGLSIAALERHLAQFKQRIDMDDETGCYHMAMVAWHALALLANQLRGNGTDDRTTYLKQESAPK